MTVSQYRDLATELFRYANDLKACVNDTERARWIPYAEKLRLQAWSVAGTCKRATDADIEKMQRCRAALDSAYDSVLHLVNTIGV